jgi:hypothetical protein
VFVFAQCGAAGDIYPQGMFRHRAELAMVQRKGITWRRELGRRIADGVDRAFSVAESSIDMNPDFQHQVVRVDLPETDPARPPFYACDPVKPVVLHVLRLGEAAVITNPFELFTDYGIRIQARSKAVLTLVVQLARHHSGYLPTARAVAGGGYSADKFVVGPEGAAIFVDESVAAINAFCPWALREKSRHRPGQDAGLFPHHGFPRIAGPRRRGRGDDHHTGSLVCPDCAGVHPGRQGCGLRRAACWNKPLPMQPTMPVPPELDYEMWLGPALLANPFEKTDVFR